MTDRQLITKAQAASEKAYAPYSKYYVGAALETTDGAIFTGCNIENASLGDTICAERVAVAKAVSEGKRSFHRMAIYADGESFCLPCGSCRQVLAEFSPDMEILCVRNDGAYVSHRLGDLIPHTFKFR